MSVLGSNPRARVDVNHPESFGVCDLCGFLYNLVDLKKQQEWRGNNLVWTGYLRCDDCLDVPFQLDRPLFIPPDPQAVPNARPPQWAEQEGDPPADIPVQQLIQGDD